MFKEAKRRISERKLFSPWCKIDILKPKVDLYEDFRVGFLACSFFPRKTKGLPVESCHGKAGHIVDGGWTNGFIMAREVISKSNCDIFYKFPEKNSLFEIGVKAKFACLVYFYKAQNSPVAVFCSDSKSLIFQLQVLDYIFSKLSKKYDEFELFFDKNYYGLIVKTLNEPVVFIAKIEFPVLVEASIISYAEKYYALCRN